MGLRCVFFDWGGTLMSEDGPENLPMARWPMVATLPDARAVLARLAARWPIAIATNADVSNQTQIAQALARGGLVHLISRIFCYTELGVRKDAPAFWTTALARMGVAADEAAMIGDSLTQDVIAPARCGLRTIWFAPDSAVPTPPGVVRVTALAQIPAWLDAFDGAGGGRRDPAPD